MMPSRSTPAPPSRPTGGPYGPDLVVRMAQYAGASESFRNYQNNILFLVADKDQVDQMVAETRRFLAVERITGSSERMREFSNDHQRKLREMKQAAELNVRVAITKTYRYLFYPTADAPKDGAFLRRENVTPQGQGDVNVDQTNVVVRLLHNLQKVRTSDDNPLPAAFVKNKAWDRNQVEMTTDDLRRAFARKVSLPLLLDVNQLQRTIENGVKTRTWIYYNAQEDWAFDHESPATFWEVSGNTRLYAPAEAERLQLHIKGRWQPPPQPTAGSGGQVTPAPEDEPPIELLTEVVGSGRPTRVDGAGVPAQAFQQLLDRCAEHGVLAIRRLTLSFQGINRSQADSLVAIGLAIPQLGKAQFGITLRLDVQFGAPPGGERFELRFQGEWDRYKRIKPVTDAFVREDVHSMSIDCRLIVDFGRDTSLDDPQVATMRDVLVQIAMGPLQLIADVVYA